MSKKANQEILRAGDAASARKVTEESWSKRFFPELCMKFGGELISRWKPPTHHSGDGVHLPRIGNIWCGAFMHFKCCVVHWQKGASNSPKRKREQRSFSKQGDPEFSASSRMVMLKKGSTYIEQEVKEMK